MKKSNLPIDDPGFWRERVRDIIIGEKPLYISIYNMPRENWEEIRHHHQRILASKVMPEDRILDAGCAYGRLLTLMPSEWKKQYLGIDLSPEFIWMAKLAFPHREFICADLRNIPDSVPDNGFDWAIMISVEGVVEGNLGKEAWQQVLASVRCKARRILLLSYEQPGVPVVIT